MAFKDIRMPQRICETFQGGPSFATALVRAPSGFTQANVNRPDALWQYEASAFLKDFETRMTLTAFFLALEGMGNTFRFRDMGHYWTGCDKYPGRGDISPLAAGTITTFATGDNTTHDFQLKVPYVFGSLTILRPITKPAKIDATDNPGYNGPKLYVETGNGTNTYTTITPGVGGNTLDYGTGIAHLTTAPATGARIKWAGLFDVHARFQDDTQLLQLLESPEAANLKIRVMEELGA